MSANKKYQVVYVVPGSKQDSVHRDPLLRQIGEYASLLILPVDEEKPVMLPELYDELMRQLGNNNRPVIVIIHAFLRLEEEGVTPANVWEPSDDKMDRLLQISAKENALLSLRLHNILLRKWREDAHIYITTNKLQITAWRSFDISSAFHDRERCTVYHWDDDLLVSDLGARIKKKLYQTN